MKLFSYYNEEKHTEYTWYKSSDILYTEYCDDGENKNTMKVVFEKGGATYLYKGVAVQNYLYLRESETQGKTFSYLKKEYKWEYEKLEPYNKDLILEEYSERSGNVYYIINDGCFEIRNNKETIMYHNEKELPTDTLLLVTDIIESLGYKIRLRERKENEDKD